MTMRMVRKADMDTVNLADAKARFSELVDRVAAGDTVNIPRRARPWLGSRPPTTRANPSIWP